jgi:DNA-binding transcriptional LysR family regulator
MRNIPMDTLRAFITVADLGSVTLAADQLGRSQPATSLQIKRLEDLLSTELFLRINKRLILSEQGHTLYSYAKEILRLNDTTLELFNKPALQGKIRLGIPSEFATTLLPKIVGRFAQAYPNVALEVFSDLSKNLVSEEQREQFDLILALHNKPSIRRKGRIKSDELVWVGCKEHRCEQQQELPLVMAQDGCLYRKRAVQSLEKIGQPWRIVHTNPDLSGIRTAIEEGLGVTVLARSTVPPSLDILHSYSHLPALGSVDISLVYDTRKISEATQRLVEFIHSSLL